MADIKVPNINTCTIAGRLTRDAEIKYTGDGKAICEFQIACQRTKETADFIAVQCWEKTAEIAGEFRKGDPVIIEGRVITDTWEKDGKKQSKTRVRAHRVYPLTWPDGGGSRAATKDNSAAGEQDDEDLPF